MKTIRALTLLAFALLCFSTSALGLAKMASIVPALDVANPHQLGHFIGTLMGTVLFIWLGRLSFVRGRNLIAAPLQTPS
ncbi:hypothetical protein [Pseudomarimonas arenosa]|uniref:HupE/UreJ protein n=1 Tax=Pseudomarimonas arenosa TaxID=2774145 RepID=A0AAW3ZT03_9GAMM|nr:hypothetical protein [Pseudomarimonas arenosa]MBD8528177.1 hypothetical protein [Pseudomarimonas arenosa]